MSLDCISFRWQPCSAEKWTQINGANNSLPQNSMYLWQLSLKTVCFIRLQSGSQTFAQIWTFRTWMHVSGKGCDFYIWNFLEFQGLFHNVVCCALSSHLSPFVKRCACHVIILWRSEVSDVTKAETLHCKKTLNTLFQVYSARQITPKPICDLTIIAKFV